MENIKHQFKIIVEQDEDGYFIASVPALPGCFTQAKNLTELKKRIKEAILLCLEMAETDLEYKEKVKLFAYSPSFIGIETINI